MVNRYPQPIRVVIPAKPVPLDRVEANAVVIVKPIKDLALV